MSERDKETKRTAETKGGKKSIILVVEPVIPDPSLDAGNNCSIQSWTLKKTKTKTKH